MNELKCLECAIPLKGRTDQKFCSNQCRNAHNNNKIYLESNSLILSVNRILQKNHSILTMLQAIGITAITKIDLQKRGYRFDFFTSKGISRNNNICYYCYDHGFREVDQNNIVLLKLVLEEDEQSPSLFTERGHRAESI